MIFWLVFTAPAKFEVELRAKIGHYRNRTLTCGPSVASYLHEKQTSRSQSLNKTIELHSILNYILVSSGVLMMVKFLRCASSLNYSFDPILSWWVHVCHQSAHNRSMAGRGLLKLTWKVINHWRRQPYFILANLFWNRVLARCMSWLISFAWAY